MKCKQYMHYDYNKFFPDIAYNNKKLIVFMFVCTVFMDKNIYMAQKCSPTPVKLFNLSNNNNNK